MPSAKPCLDCGKPTRAGSRCPTCAQVREQKRDQQRGTRTARGYTNDWLRLSRAAIAASPICAHCGTTNDLTTDHPVAMALGGERLPTDPVVLCRSCNSAKGAS